MPRKNFFDQQSPIYEKSQAFCEEAINIIILGIKLSFAHDNFNTELSRAHDKILMWFRQYVMTPDL